MTKRRTDPSPAGDETDELRAAVERLTEHVQTLTQAIDELFDELQWRNNNHRQAEDASVHKSLIRERQLQPRPLR